MRLPMRSWYETWTRFWPLARRRRRACKVAGTLRRAVAAPLVNPSSALAAIIGTVRCAVEGLARDGFRAMPDLFGGPTRSAAHRDRKRRSALQQLEARELLTGTMQIHDGPNILANGANESLGTVNVGATDTKSLTVMNTSFSGSLTVSSASLPAASICRPRCHSRSAPTNRARWCWACTPRPAVPSPAP